MFSKVLDKPVVYSEMSLELVNRIMPVAIAQIYNFIVANPNKVPTHSDVFRLTGQNGYLETFMRNHMDYF